jgi:hypothetical protein
MAVTIAEAYAQQPVAAGPDLPNEIQIDQRIARKPYEAVWIELGMEILQCIRQRVPLAVARREVYILTVSDGRDELVDGNDPKTLACTGGDALEKSACGVIESVHGIASHYAMTLYIPTFTRS